MLKKELQEELNVANNIIKSLQAETEVNRDLIRDAAEKAKEHRKLAVHVSDARTAIDAIVSINCGDIMEWHRHGNPSLMYAQDNNEAEPVCPPITELYSSLRHIEEILNRPVTKPKKDTRFGY